MPAKSDNFTFLTASAVLVAEPHNPAIINPDFLRNKGIVPAEWVSAPDPICTPAFAHVAYRNGLSVLVDPGRCTFAEMLNDTPKDVYLAHLCAKEYAKVIEYNYSALGLNWRVGFAPENPSNWLKDRFFRPGEWRNILTITSFSFSMSAPGSARSVTCNITLQESPQTSQESVAPVTMFLDCNFDVDLKGVSEKTKRISDIFERGKEFESFLIQLIDEYLVKNLS